MSWRCDVCFERDGDGSGCACDRAKEAAERMPELEAYIKRLEEEKTTLRRRLALVLWLHRDRPYVPACGPTKVYCSAVGDHPYACSCKTGRFQSKVPNKANGPKS